MCEKSVVDAENAAYGSKNPIYIGETNGTVFVIGELELDEILQTELNH